jgi:hypothetical protein
LRSTRRAADLANDGARQIDPELETVRQFMMGDAAGRQAVIDVLQIFLGRDDDPSWARNLPGLEPRKALLAKLLDDGAQIFEALAVKRGILAHFVDYESEALPVTPQVRIDQTIRSTKSLTPSRPWGPGHNYVQPCVRRSISAGIELMKQGAGARKVLIPYADLAPVFPVFRAAEILERRCSLSPLLPFSSSISSSEMS